MKISWTEHRSNKEVLDMVDENRSLMNTIRQRHKDWLGHVSRSESLLCTVLEDRMERTRTRGRQSVTMIDWMKSNDVEYEHIKKRIHDRDFGFELLRECRMCFTQHQESVKVVYLLLRSFAV